MAFWITLSKKRYCTLVKDTTLSGIDYLERDTTLSTLCMDTVVKIEYRKSVLKIENGKTLTAPKFWTFEANVGGCYLPSG